MELSSKFRASQSLTRGSIFIFRFILPQSVRPCKKQHILIQLQTYKNKTMFSHSELITHIRKFESVRHAKAFLLQQLPKKITFLTDTCWNFISQHLQHSLFTINTHASFNFRLPISASETVTNVSISKQLSFQTSSRHATLHSTFITDNMYHSPVAIDHRSHTP